MIMWTKSRSKNCLPGPRDLAVTLQCPILRFFSSDRATSTTWSSTSTRWWWCTRENGGTRLIWLSTTQSSKSRSTSTKNPRAFSLFSSFENKPRTAQTPSRCTACPQALRVVSATFRCAPTFAKSTAVSNHSFLMSDAGDRDLRDLSGSVMMALSYLSLAALTTAILQWEYSKIISQLF